MGELSKLKGLGPKSEQSLNEIGIYTQAQLRDVGAVRAFILLKNAGRFKPSLNFLYAMVGALQGEHWANIAQSERTRLLTELHGHQELQAIVEAEELRNGKS